MIEVREVDAGVVDAATGVLAGGNHVAAQNGDLAVAVEDADVGTDLGRDLGRDILRVQEARVGQQQHRRLALAFELGGAQVQPSVALELRQRLGRFLARQQHGVAEMQAAYRIGEELVAEDALVDLQAFLVGLAQFRLSRDIALRRHQARHHVGGVVDQAFDAHELPAVVGQPVIERAGMGAQEGEAGVARRLLERLSGRCRRGIALRLRRQTAQPLAGIAPKGRKDGRIGLEAAIGRDRCRDHRIHIDVPAHNDCSLDFGAGDGI